MPHGTCTRRAAGSCDFLRFLIYATESFVRSRDENWALPESRVAKRVGARDEFAPATSAITIPLNTRSRRSKIVHHNLAAANCFVKYSLDVIVCRRKRERGRERDVRDGRTTRTFRRSRLIISVHVSYRGIKNTPSRVISCRFIFHEFNPLWSAKRQDPSTRDGSSY